MNINYKIFVYGTLIDHLLKDAIPGADLHITKRERGKINARLFDMGAYPGVKRTSLVSKQVVGKIYEIEPEHFNNTLSLLDNYEEYDPAKKKDSLYVRKLTKVVTEGESFCMAWVYWYNKPVDRKTEIETGDYQKYLKLNMLKKNALK